MQDATISQLTEKLLLVLTSLEFFDNKPQCSFYSAIKNKRSVLIIKVYSVKPQLGTGNLECS